MLGFEWVWDLGLRIQCWVFREFEVQGLEFKIRLGGVRVEGMFSFSPAAGDQRGQQRDDRAEGSRG